MWLPKWWIWPEKRGDDSPERGCRYLYSAHAGEGIAGLEEAINGRGFHEIERSA